MRAGILTFHQADNYGAVLQAYALQTTLARLGVESELISLQKAGPHSRQEHKAASAFARKLQEEQKKRAALFEQFRKKRLVCAEPVPQEQAGELDGRYDVFIAGSDQIWNIRIPEADGRYFLPFASPDKRVSYAASFGMEDIPDNYREWYAKGLEGFRALSVREKRGQEIVKALTGRDCAVCLDPVFLLSRDVWQTLAPDDKRVPYVFLPMVQFDQALLERAKAYAEDKGLDLRVVTAGFAPQCGFPAWSGTGVEEWIGAFQYAECVFTNSFHAVAFSLLFGRPVSVAPLSGALGERGGRVAELLEWADLADCLDGEPRAISPEKFSRCIDGLKQDSLQYLKSAVTPGPRGEM